MEKKIYKKYIDCVIPMKLCNLKCSYCYVHKTQEKDLLPPLKYSVEHITTKGLSKKRLGGNAIINLCGAGETTLYPELFNLVKGLLKQGHVVSIVSNGTTSEKFDEFLKTLPEEYLSRLFFKLSLHYLELKRKNLLDIFADNVKKILNSPASFTVEMGASDDYIPYIDEIKKYSLENFGALPHITILRDNDNPKKMMTNLTKQKYKQIWSSFDSSFFDIRWKYWNSPSNKTYCFAGYFTNTIDLIPGILRPCSFLEKSPYEINIFENTAEEYPCIPIGYKCPAEHCVLCHAFLAFGDKPQLDTPTYTTVRNRVMTDGREWLKDTIKDAFNTKMYETNPDYKDIQKRYPQGYNVQTLQPRMSLLENIFSIKNSYSNNIKRKIITVCGAKIKVKCGSNK